MRFKDEIEKVWLVKNWEFLLSRQTKVLPVNMLSKLFRDPKVTPSGKFYGTEEFLALYSPLSAVTANGIARLALRPYIFCEMPNSSIRAVYIDPKKYIFDEDGMIVGLSSLYENAVYIFKGFGNDLSYDE